MPRLVADLCNRSPMPFTHQWAPRPIMSRYANVAEGFASQTPMRHADLGEFDENQAQAATVTVQSFDRSVVARTGQHGDLLGGNSRDSALPNAYVVLIRITPSLKNYL
jgi:hypothetical protein